MLIDAPAAVQPIGKPAYCGRVRRLRDVRGWVRNPLGTTPRRRAGSAPTRRRAASSGTVTSGSRRWYRHRRARAIRTTSTAAHLDPLVADRLPARSAPDFRYYFAHSSNSSDMDFFRPTSRRRTASGRVVRGARGANTDLPAGRRTVSMTPWAGQTSGSCSRPPIAGGEHGRGGRRRRPDHPPVSGSRTRIVVPHRPSIGRDLAPWASTS
jgi:hypothetical protein